MIHFFENFKELPPSKTRIEDPEEIKKTYTSLRIRMFFGMYIGYVFYYFTRKNISAVLHIFSQELQISIKEIGILSTVFYITYGIGKFLSGVLADRSNIRYFLPFGLYCASIINLFFCYLDSLWLLGIFWGLNGAFQSMGFPPVAKGLVHWYSPKERATKWTLWSSSHTAGTFFIGILVTFLLKYVGWRSAFYIPGIFGLITSIILLKTLKDRPVSVGLPPIEEFKNDPMPVKTEVSMSHWQLLKKYVFFNYHLWALCFAYVFVYIIRFGTLDWATKFMYDARKIDRVRVSFMWAIMPLFGMPGGIVAGWLADKFFNGRCTIINIIYLLLLAGSIYGFYIVAGMEHFYLTCFFLGCIGFFVDGPQNLVGGVQVSRVTVQKAASTACGFSGMFGYIGAAISGVGLAYITKHYGWQGMYNACIVSCLLAAVLVSFTWKKENSHFREQQLQTKA